MPLSRDVLLRAGTFGPSVSGLILAYLFGGKDEIRSLLRSMLRVRIGAGWLLFAFFVLPAVSAVTCLIFWLAGGALPQPEFDVWLIPVAFLYILVLMGPGGMAGICAQAHAAGRFAGEIGVGARRCLDALAPSPVFY